MKKVIFIILISIIGQALQASTVREERTTKVFTAIENNCSADIIITQGDEYGIFVNAAEKYIDKIKTEVRAGTLVIDIKGNIYNTSEIVIEVSVKNLHEIVMNSSGDIEIEGQLSSSSFNLELHGSGDFEGAFNVKDMEVSIHGSGDAEISGINGSLNLTQRGSGDFEGESLHLASCYLSMNSSGDTELSGTSAMMEVKQNGSGDFDGRSFKVQTAKIRKTSSGKADVYVTDTIDASISGSGDLNIKGSPEITNFSASGSGSIHSF
ncbi:MAG: hypothetical protein GQ527_08155 [Bacteroidales bacterium]|nr:hypothetical protein [Bacteroidales bacterium]